MAVGLEAAEIAISRSRDEDLLEQYRNGNGEALETLIRDYIPRVYKKVRVLVPESDVLDVMQEIFLSLVESIDNIRSRTNFAAWFNRITISRIADYYRKRSRRRDKVTGNEFLEIDETQDDATWRNIDDRLTMEEVLVEMPENYTQILVLKFLEGRSLTEISNQLHLAYETTRSKYRRAIGMLQKTFDGAI